VNAPCQDHLMELTKNFTHITCTYLSHKDDQFVDVLAKLASMINIPRGIHFMPLTIESRSKSAHCYTIELCSVDLIVWYYDIYRYL